MSILSAAKNAADILIWGTYSQKKRHDKRMAKLKAVVNTARDYSPHFNRQLSGVGDGYSISELPTSTSEQLKDKYAIWLTDRELDTKDFAEAMADQESSALIINDKYLLTRASAEGAYIIRTLAQQSLLSAIYILRSGVSLGEHLRAALRGNLCADVCVKADGTAKLRFSRNTALPYAGRYCGGELRYTDELLADLNNMKPAVIRGCAASISRLVALAENGELNASPVYVRINAHKGADMDIPAAQAAFSCRAHGELLLPEFGDVANTCKYKHFHVNDDAVLFEAVDEQGEPVADGIKSSRILVTDLNNRVQPMVRFELDYSVIMHSERCQCGKSGKWFELA